MPTLHCSHILTSCTLARLLSCPGGAGRAEDRPRGLCPLIHLLGLGACSQPVRGLWSPTLLMTRIEAEAKSTRPLGFMLVQCILGGHSTLLRSWVLVA